MVAVTVTVVATLRPILGVITEELDMDILIMIVNSNSNSDSDSK